MVVSLGRSVFANNFVSVSVVVSNSVAVAWPLSLSEHVLWRVCCLFDLMSCYEVRSFDVERAGARRRRSGGTQDYNIEWKRRVEADHTNNIIILMKLLRRPKPPIIILEGF